eukprot:11218929-Lingulodinium_polyedra.AAC.1
MYLPLVEGGGRGAQAAPAGHWERPPARVGASARPTTPEHRVPGQRCHDPTWGNGEPDCTVRGGVQAFEPVHR